MDGFQNDPLLHHDLFLDNVTENAPLFALIVIQSPPDLFIDPPWNDGHGHDMGMGMAVIYARIILQDEELLKTPILLQVGEPLSVGEEDLLDLMGFHESKALSVFRCFHDDFVSPDGLHHIVHPFRSSIEFSLNMEEGEFIGDDADRPSSPFKREGEGLFGCCSFISRTERADSLRLLRLIRGFKGEVIGWPSGMLGCHHHPHSGDGFSPQLCHETLLCEKGSIDKLPSPMGLVFPRRRAFHSYDESLLVEIKKPCSAGVHPDTLFFRQLPQGEISLFHDLF